MRPIYGSPYEQTVRVGTLTDRHFFLAAAPKAMTVRPHVGALRQGVACGRPLLADRARTQTPAHRRAARPSGRGLLPRPRPGARGCGSSGSGQAVGLDPGGARCRPRRAAPRRQRGQTAQARGRAVSRRWRGQTRRSGARACGPPRRRGLGRAWAQPHGGTAAWQRATRGHSASSA